VLRDQENNGGGFCDNNELDETSMKEYCHEENAE
jgi:hypothetical protein